MLPWFRRAGFAAKFKERHYSNPNHGEGRSWTSYSAWLPSRQGMPTARRAFVPEPVVLTDNAAMTAYSVNDRKLVFQ
jgi:hypothetical protein